MFLHIAKSLKHIQSKKCVHTLGAWPAVDRELVIWSGCDETRLEIWFMKAGRGLIQLVQYNVTIFFSKWLI